jgi:serine/threonine protein kinase
MQHLFVAGDEPVPGYRLLEELEGSAFFKVWRVQTPEGGQRWWKVVDLVVGNAAIETRTLGLLVRLRHPHLNTLTNFWNLDDGKTLVIESEVPVRSLRDLLAGRSAKEGRGVPLEEVLPYFEQAAEGLDFLNKPQHEYNGQLVAIYHRSLRPECLLLFEEQGRLVCKVSDFGLSKPVTDEVAQHSQGLVHYDYDPPEFFEGQTAPTSDQYSLAINYYELRTGEMPFTGTMLEQLQARLNDKPNLSYIPEPERSIVRKALRRDPSLRFKSCLDFVKHLREGKAPEGAATSVSAAPAANALAGSRSADPSLSGIAAPRPSFKGAGSPSWRSPAAAVAQPKGARSAPSDSPPGHGQPPLASPAFAHGSAGEDAAPDVRPPRPFGQEAAVHASASVPPPKRPSPSGGSTLVPAANLRSIREHISAGGAGFADSYAGERRIPVVWAVAILSCTALASVWLASLLGR